MQLPSWKTEDEDKSQLPLLVDRSSRKSRKHSVARSACLGVTVSGCAAGGIPSALAKSSAHSSAMISVSYSCVDVTLLYATYE